MDCTPKEILDLDCGLYSKTDGVSNTLNTLRGDPFITFAPRGGGIGVKEVANFANDSTDRLRETANEGGGGPKSRKFCEGNKYVWSLIGRGHQFPSAYAAIH